MIVATLVTRDQTPILARDGSGIACRVAQPVDIIVFTGTPIRSLAGQGRTTSLASNTRPR